MKKYWIFQPFEFWPNATSEIPYHCFLLLWAVRRRIWWKAFFKANYTLPYGGLQCASKHELQQKMGKHLFPKTVLIPATASDSKKKELLLQAIDTLGLPLFVKPDLGMTGRGVARIQNKKDVDAVLPLCTSDYIAQEFVPGTVEFGVFWERHNGIGRITGINQKHYPTVVGDGTKTLQELARGHFRYTNKWESFLVEVKDIHRIPSAGESVQLSVVGTHTMGCKFTDDTHLCTPELVTSLSQKLQDVPGYNFGRFDVKANSVEAFQRGEFAIVEANGVESMPTHMFDPRYNFQKALRILWGYAKRWSAIAKENSHQPMDMPPWWLVIKRNTDVVYAMQRQQQLAQDLATSQRVPKKE